MTAPTDPLQHIPEEPTARLYQPLPMTSGTARRRGTAEAKRAESGSVKLPATLAMATSGSFAVRTEPNSAYLQRRNLSKSPRVGFHACRDARCIGDGKQRQLDAP